MAHSPRLSVVIPMCNEEHYIGPCLESVIDQDYPPERVEIIVVDGGSGDASPEVVRHYAERTGRVRLLQNPRKIVPTALNIGIRAARGDVIVRVDAHTTLSRDYLRAGVSALERSGADNVGGPMIARGGGGFGEAVAAATSSRFGIGAYFHFGTDEKFVDTVYMGMWPRALFTRVGLFDEELVRNQDDEFNYRLRKLGGRVLMTPRMRSSYQNRSGVRALARQYFQYGLWKVRVCQKHPRQMSWRHFAPPALVLALLSIIPACWLAPSLAAAASGIAAVYGMALALASRQTARRAGSRDIPGITLAFVTIHTAWGLGFLAGLLRFAPLWFRNEPVPPQLVTDQQTTPASVD